VPSLALLTLHLYLPGCTSLKDKRRRVKPILARLHREFNLSVAEVDHLDAWQETVIACALVSNDPVFNQKVIQQVLQFVDATWPDQPVMDHQLELL
jgi:uncharacterized protein YlxP (DUF503 family)